ncbi:MAG: class I adenylate-forming enzyme family protein [Nitrospinota bacterium]|jgi:non-ribosomal peptide synthetase component E (peptide arylation enzyme)|nr:class I adenylate-forming enzyme family protein [Nitrospinota bacterium]HJM43862.1 class I adenylate-forming enzyme family protein [Nitrospinota bacterium]
MIERRRRPPHIERLYREKGYWGTTLDAAFAERLNRCPHREVLRDSRGGLTFAGLSEAALRLARALHDLGVGFEDRVVVQLPDGRDFAAVHLALARLRAITVPVVPTYRAREMKAILSSSGAVGVVTPGVFRGFDYAGMVEGLRGNLPSLRWAATAGEQAHENVLSLPGLLAADPLPRDAYPSGEPESGDVLVLLWTAGSTGPSKGILRTHDALLCHAATLARDLGYSAGTTIANFCPLTHVAGLVLLYIGFRQGSRLAVLERFEAERALDLIEETRAEVVAAVPTQTIALLEAAAGRPEALRSVRKIHSGGGACPGAVKRQILIDWGITFIDLYGMTEGVSATTRPEDPSEKVMTTSGKPGRSEEEMRILDAEGKPLPSGEAGEIVSLSPILFSGYFDDPKRTREAHTPEGWFRTGDLGYFDPEGYLHVVGRQKEIIRRGSETIHPKEVEELLMTHPRIGEVAVVGVPDERYGERACAFVKTVDGETLTLEEVIRRLETAGLARFKFPERVEMVLGNFPRTADGKIHKLVLRQGLSEK